VKGALDIFVIKDGICYGIEVIRNELARNPLISVLQLQNVLKERGRRHGSGKPLRWHYLAKLVRKLNREKALAVDTRKINERLAI
jgi:hypothetical protein